MAAQSHFFELFLIGFFAVGDHAEQVARLLERGEQGARFLGNVDLRMMICAHVRGELRGQVRGLLGRTAHDDQAAAPEGDPEFFLILEQGAVGLDFGRVGKVVMLPAVGAQAVFFADGDAEREGVIVENLPAVGEVVTERAVEVEENGFDHKL